jgi:hypothetical protein
VAAPGPDGTFAIDDFPLPAADTNLSGAVCASAPGTCAVRWAASTEGAATVQQIPLDLSG